MKNRDRFLAVLAAALLVSFIPAAAEVLYLGDDDYEAVDIGFTFDFCGYSYDTVYVGSNGFLTFGGGSTSFSESVYSFLGSSYSALPRIAMYWDDFAPHRGGTIEVFRDNNTLTVAFTDVPEYYNTGANTFSATLNKGSNQIDFNYGAMTSTDGLAGVSCGYDATLGIEEATDITDEAEEATISLRNRAAWYELFSYSTTDNDLSGKYFSVSAPNVFIDTSEKNDSVQHATPINLPFDSGDQIGNSGQLFTTIEPAGDDVDFFKFRADEGMYIAMETYTGSDTVIGIFDDEGTLLAYDDDGGSGLLSSLTILAPYSGQYYVAVSTYPDYDFSGNGYSGRRYALTVDVTDELVLDISGLLGDDTSAVGPISCGTFTFNGTTYDEIYINANGSVQFGDYDTDYTESVYDFLNEGPRIAALWDDLYPYYADAVNLYLGSDRMMVEYINVPAWLSGSNTFSTEIICATGEINIVYGHIDTLDALVGVTEGWGATDPGETDLSAAGQPIPATGTTYELFTGYGDDFDMANTSLAFAP